MKKTILIIICLILLSSLVNAASLVPRHYRDYQEIETVTEWIRFEKNKININFYAKIRVDKDVLNQSNFISFDFSPKFSNYDEFIIHESEVGWQTSEYPRESPININKKADYQTRENNGYYYYNVSLSNFEEENHIILHVNYDLTNRISKVGNNEYSFFIIKLFSSKTHTMTVYIPNKYEIKDVTVPGKWNYGPEEKTFTMDQLEQNKLVHFYLLDTDEKWWREFWTNIAYASFGLMAGSFLSIFFEPWLKKIFKKNKKKIQETKQKTIKTPLTQKSK